MGTMLLRDTPPAIGAARVSCVRRNPRMRWGPARMRARRARERVGPCQERTTPPLPGPIDEPAACSWPRRGRARLPGRRPRLLAKRDRSASSGCRRRAASVPGAQTPRWRSAGSAPTASISSAAATATATAISRGACGQPPPSPHRSNLSWSPDRNAGALMAGSCRPYRRPRDRTRADLVCAACVSRRGKVPVTACIAPVSRR